MIGEINPNSSTIKYFTKWIEEMSMRTSTTLTIINFIEKNILCRYGILRKLVIDNEVCFTTFEMIEFCNKYHIDLSH